MRQKFSERNLRTPIKEISALQGPFFSCVESTVSRASRAKFCWANPFRKKKRPCGAEKVAPRRRRRRGASFLFQVKIDCVQKKFFAHFSLGFAFLRLVAFLVGRLFARRAPRVLCFFFRALLLPLRGLYGRFFFSPPGEHFWNGLKSFKFLSHFSFFWGGCHHVGTRWRRPFYRPGDFPKM